MRIGILAPIAWRVPPRDYGGWELVAYHLTEGLVRRGHDVTLFATADSRTSARLISVVPRPLAQDEELRRYARAYESLHTATAFAHAREFDILHNHLGSYPLCFTANCPVPVVTTLHGSGAEEDSRLIYSHFRDYPYVSITDAERSLVPDLRYAATVYHGLDAGEFPFGAEPGTYLLVVGRMSPDKGIHHAIAVARQVGLPLILAGIAPPENEAYFAAQIAPHLDDRIRFVGPVTLEEKGKLYAGAYAFLHLITYEEAFGLTMIEAMACGCPVVAVKKGSVPELVVDGVTGFIVERVEDAATAVRRCGELDRAACRRHVVEHFPVEQMVAGYEAVYRSVLGR